MILLSKSVWGEVQTKQPRTIRPNESHPRKWDFGQIWFNWRIGDKENGYLWTMWLTCSLSADIPLRSAVFGSKTSTMPMERNASVSRMSCCKRNRGSRIFTTSSCRLTNSKKIIKNQRQWSELRIVCWLPIIHFVAASLSAQLHNS